MVSQTAAFEFGQRTRPITKEADKQYEAELVRRACDGDGDAFGQLYERTMDRVYRYIYFRVSDEQTAEDLSSKVYLKAWESLPRFKAGSSPFIAWLYTIAHNAVIDHYRVSKPTTQLDEAATLASPEPLPDAHYETVSAARSLRRALERLTDDQREVITMRLLDGMTTDEVASRLRRSAGAIRALQMRGLQALAKILQDEKWVERDFGKFA